MCALKVQQRRIRISRTSSKDFFKSYKPYMSNKQAKSIAGMVNLMNPTSAPKGPEDIVSRGKNFVFSTHKDTGAVIGSSQIKRHTWDRCEVCNFSVDPGYRRQGVGSTLLQQVEERAAKRNFKVIDAVIFENNTASKRMFEKGGYTKQFMYTSPEQSYKIMGVWQKDVKRPCPDKKQKRTYKVKQPK